jgi:hypothetical protein
MAKADEMFNGWGDEEKQELWAALEAVVAPLDYEGKFSVVTVSSADLEARVFDTFSFKGSVGLGDWTGLADLLNEDEANLHKADFETVESYVVALYTDEQYVTTIQGEY